MLTGGLSRRGLHLSREYGVDPLETVMVGDVMHTSVFALPWETTKQAAVDWLTKMNERGGEAWSHWQRLFPLVDEEGNLRGVLYARQYDCGSRCRRCDGSAFEVWNDGTGCRWAARYIALCGREDGKVEAAIISGGEFVWEASGHPEHRRSA